MARANAEAEAMVRARDRAMQTANVVRQAFLRPPLRCLGTLFHPLSLGALWLLEEIESCLLREDNGAQQITLEIGRAAFVLAESERARDALGANRVEFEKQVVAFSSAFGIAQLPELFQVVQTVVGDGLETIPGAGASASGGDSLGPPKNSGNGWTLSLLDTMLAEYSWPAYVDYAGAHRGPVDFVLWRLPLAQAFCLYRATAARYGVEMKGPTFVELAMIKARREVEAEARRECGKPSARASRGGFCSAN